jgi:hypothetical protein
MQIVRKAVHQHEGRAGPGIVAHINAALGARDPVLGEGWLVRHGVNASLKGLSGIATHHGNMRNRLSGWPMRAWPMRPR